MHQTIYQEIQQLRQFIIFLTAQPFVNLETRLKLAKIDYYIEHINNPDLQRYFDASIEIFDYRNYLNNLPNQYPKWRTWVIYIEDNYLKIKAESESVNNKNNKNNHLSYYCDLPLLNNPNQEIFKNGEIEIFIKDALNYKSYITETLCELETQVNIED